jgi:hypothetical protein
LAQLDERAHKRAGCSGRPATIHYRDWLAALQACGYVVLGRNPAATFLSNILPSPIVAHGPQPGAYFVDDTIAPRLRHELASTMPSCATCRPIIAAGDDVAPTALREPARCAARRCAASSRSCGTGCASARSRRLTAAT